MDLTQQHPVAWRLLQGALLGALVCSFWAFLGAPGCGACRSVAALGAGKLLPSAGILVYLALFGASWISGLSPLVSGGILLAAGVQTGLAILLLRSGLPCAACLGAWISSLAALGASLRMDPALWLRASFGLPGAALVAQAVFLLGLREPGRSREEIPLPSAQSVLARETRVASGTARMIAYTRADCGFCIQLERDILPALEGEFGDRLVVERRPSSEVPGMPTPTLILSGAEARHLYPGLPELGELRKTLKQLIEGTHE